MREGYNKQKPVLKNSVVCFVDILGFSNIVTKACNEKSGNELLKKLHNAINNNMEFISPYFEGYSELKMFTDNIAIGVPIYGDGESQLGGVFLGFAFYQLSLALEGFFIRGGITIGEYYADDKMAFGLPIIEAHTLESEVANTPRIILGNIAVEYVKKHINYYSMPEDSPQSKHLLRDVDGNWFINYLEAVFEDTYEDVERAKKFLRQHRDIVSMKIIEFQNDTRVLNKYLWVANYHNYFCSLNFKNDSELLVKNNMNFGEFGLII